MIRLLIVDDSAFMRKIITDIVEEIEGIEVVGIARNGMDALEVIPKLQPDVITLDIEMPKLNGIQTLKKIKERHDIPVIMLSSIRGTDITIEALQIGALDFIEKPKDLQSDLQALKGEIEEKIKSISFESHLPKKTLPKKQEGKDLAIDKDIKAVVIAASTGGPRALVYLLSRLPRNIKVPIFIVQHMPKGFTTSFAERLDKESLVKVVEAEDGMSIRRGVVYLAPGDYHMTISGNKISLNSQDKLHGVRPAADHLFRSATEHYGDKLLGLIFTGMGRDGAEGMKCIKEKGGYNIVQNRESCVVYGMPGSAVALGVVHETMDLEDISINLNKLIKVK